MGVQLGHGSNRHLSVSVHGIEGIRLMTFATWLSENWMNIVTGTIALTVVTATVALAATGQPIPDNLSSITSMVIAFFFGSQVPRPIAVRRAEAQLAQNGTD